MLPLTQYTALLRALTKLGFTDAQVLTRPAFQDAANKLLREAGTVEDPLTLEHLRNQQPTASEHELLYVLHVAQAIAHELGWPFAPAIIAGNITVNTWISLTKALSALPKRVVRTPHRPSRELIAEWYLSDDCGASSMYLYSLANGHLGVMASIPYDSDDLGRCIRFLDLVDDPKQVLAIAATHNVPHFSSVWAKILANWDLLIDWSKCNNTLAINQFLDATRR